MHVAHSSVHTLYSEASKYRNPVLLSSDSLLVKKEKAANTKRDRVGVDSGWGLPTLLVRYGIPTYKCIVSENHTIPVKSGTYLIKRVV